MEEMPGRFPPPPEAGPPPPFGFPPAPVAFYPLDLGRILQMSWSLFRFAWRTMLVIGLVVLVVPISIMAAISSVYGPVVYEWLERVQVATRLREPPPAPPEGFFVAVLLILAISLLLALVALLAIGALTIVVDATFRGSRLTVIDALRRAAGRYASLLGAQLLYLLTAFGILLAGFVIGGVFVAIGGLAAFLGLVAIVSAIAALVFIAVRLAFLAQTITLEGVGAAEAFGRSWRLVAGSGWRVLGYALLTGVLSGVISLILETIWSLVLALDPVVPADIVVATALDGISYVILLPLVPLVYTLLYYDLRARNGEPAPLPGEASPAAA